MRQDDSVAKPTRQLSSHLSTSWISSGCGADRISERRLRVHRFANPGTSHQGGHSEQHAHCSRQPYGCGVVSVSKTVVRHQNPSKRNRTACATDPQSLGLSNLARTQAAATSLVRAGKAQLPSDQKSLSAWAQARLEQQIVPLVRAVVRCSRFGRIICASSTGCASSADSCCDKEPSIRRREYGSAAARDRSGRRQQNVAPALGHTALTAFIAKAVVEVLALCAHRHRAQDEALVLA